MTDLDDIEKQLSDHRRRAEASLSESVQLPEAVSARSRSEVEKLVHELRVHQIELEMQNEELKRSQAELEASRARYFDLFDLAPVGYCTLNEKGLILEVNLTAASMLGMARSVLLKQPLTRFILSDDRDIYYRHHKQLFETQVPQVYELRMLSANAAPIWVQMDATVAKDADGVPMCRTIVSEITERKQAEEALRQSREDLDRAQAVGQIGWWRLDTRKNALTWSDENHRIFGVPKGTPLTYEAFLSIVHPDDRQYVTMQWAAGLQGEPYVIEHRIVAEGRVKWVREKAYLEYDREGQLLGGFGITQDITARRQAEEALRASEEQFRVLTQNLQSAVALIDEHGAFSIVNSSFLGMFDIPQDATLLNVNSRDWAQWHVFDEHGALLDVDEHPVRKAALTRTAVRNQFVAVKSPSRPDLKWLLVSAEPILDEWGGIHRLICTYYDITEHKAAEEELKRTRYTFAEAQKIAHLGSFEYVAASRTTAWSEEEYRIYGLDPAGPSPAYDVMLEKCIYPDDAALLHETFAKAMQSHTVYELEHRIVRPDGSVRWVYDRAHPYLDEDGTLLRYVGATLDITERKLMEEELRKSRDELEIRVQERTNELAEANRELMAEKGKLSSANVLLQTVFNGILDPLLMLDKDCRIRMVNEAARKYFQINHGGGPITLTCRELSLEKGGVCGNCAITGAISKGEGLTIERSGIFNAQLIEEVTVYPLGEAEGGFSGAVMRISDITESKNMEKHLMRADRLSSLGVLAGGMAHEIRNPLQGINLFVDVLSDKERFHRTDQELEICNEIKSNIRRISGIIQRVLDFSKQTEPASLIKLDVRRLVEESLKLWQSRMVNEGIQLRLSTEENLSDVHGDPIEIEQVLTNLVQNAIEAMEKGGTLSMRAENGTLSFDTKRPAVIIKVEDSGPGIPLDQQPNIFNPFFTSKYTGTGLGLAISHRIISQHGGLISFQSIPDEGTTFTVELPAASES